MKKIYAILSVIGFIAPNIWVTKVSLATGNVLFWLKPEETFAGMWANDISTAFIVDLLVVVMIFFVWTWNESKRLGMKKPYLIWVLTMLFGMAGTLPLFLYQRTSYIDQ
jgi:hypothetical protein